MFFSFFSDPICLIFDSCNLDKSAVFLDRKYKGRYNKTTIFCGNNLANKQNADVQEEIWSMASKGSRTISLILALVMVLGLFPSMSPSASAEFQEFDPASVFYGAPTIIPYGVPTDDAVNGQASVASGIPTTGLVDGQADAPVLTELVPQHVHHFVYSAEGNTIVARCDAEDCPLENGEAKLILKTDDAAKTDSVYAGASIQNDIPLPESAVLGPVVYYVLNEAELAETGAKPESFLTEENRLEIAPKRVGTYLAAVTLTVDGTDYTVWNIFEIYLPKAVFTVRPEPVEGLVYDGQPHALVTPGDAGGSTVLYAVLANDETEPTDGFDDTFPMAADAGLYVVWFRAAGDADHEDSDTDHVVVRIQKASQAAPAAPEAEVITTESITLKASEGYEYSMDGENWQSDNTFGGLTANTEYRFFQRITGDYNLEPSPAGEAAVFCTLEDAPVVEEEPEAVPVKLWLVCDPPETVLTVRSSAEGSSPVSPEEDGSYLLLPGSWICSAAAEGYQPIENSEFTISAENGDTQYMTLELQKLPPVISPAFEATAYVSGMAVRVSAPEGVFPEGSTLSVTPVPVQEQQFVDAAVGSERGGSKTVMVSYTFDIKVLGPDGNEVQPADAQKVKVSFTANAVAEQNLNTDVYHVSGEGASLSAERLDIVEDGTTVTAETSGFSYYTVEFTYDTLQYVLPGGQDVALSEILNTVGLSGEVTGVTCSRPDLFSADTRSGEWVVYSHQPFTSTEWMKVVINGLVYEIIVTDAGGDSGSSSTAGDIILYDGIYEVSTIVIDEINRPEFYLHAYYGKEKPDAYEWVLNNNGGPFSVTFREGEATGDGNFLVFGASGTSQQTKGTLNIKYYKNSGGVRTLLAERNVPVEIRKTAIPEVQVSPGDLTIDLTKTKTATVTYSCSGADGFDISLYAKGGFATYTLGSEKVENGVRSGSLTISATSAGIATLEFVALKNGETAPVAAKTIQVTVKDGTSPLPDTSEIRVFDGSTEIYEIVIDKNNRPSLDLTLSYDNKPDNYTWGLLAKGAFYCDFYKDENGKQLNTFKIWYAKTGNSETWLKINLKDGNNNIVATRTITVTIRDADLPEVYAAPDPVTLNLAGNKTAAVSYRYTGASYFLIELNTKTGSPTFRLGDGGTSSGAASITMKEVKESGSVTLAAIGTGTGTAELTFKAMKDGQTAPLAVKTVQVKVIDLTAATDAATMGADAAAKAVADAATDETVKAADPANKATKDSSGSGGGNSTAGATPVPQIGGNTNTNKKLTPEEQYEAYRKRKDPDGDLHAFWEVESTLPKELQLYRLDLVKSYKSLSGETKYIVKLHEGGDCNLSSYNTLLNRFLAYHYPDKGYTASTEDILKCLQKYGEQKYEKALKDYEANVKKGKKAKKPKQSNYVYADPYGLDTYTEYWFSSKDVDKQHPIYIKDGDEVSKGTKGAKAYYTVKEKKLSDKVYKRKGYIWHGKDILPTPSVKFTKPDYPTIETVSYAAKNYRTPDKLADLLREHPEGVYVRCARYKKGEDGKPILDKKGKKITLAEHAVIISDYKYENGKYSFTVIDPVPTSSSGNSNNPQPREDTFTYKKATSKIMETHDLQFNEIVQVYTLKAK